MENQIFFNFDDVKNLQSLKEKNSLYGLSGTFEIRFVKNGNWYNTVFQGTLFNALCNIHLYNIIMENGEFEVMRFRKKDLQFLNDKFIDDLTANDFCEMLNFYDGRWEF